MEIEFIKKATAKISVRTLSDQSGDPFVSSGFFCSMSDGRTVIVACSHGFADTRGLDYGDHIEVEYWKNGSVFSCQFYYSDLMRSSSYHSNGFDLAWIDCGEKINPETTLNVRYSMPNEGELFKTCGHSSPSGDWHEKELNSISNQKFGEFTYLFRINNENQIGEGDSGGPVVDAAGRVIAVISHSLGNSDLLVACSLFSDQLVEFMDAFPV